MLSWKLYLDTVPVTSLLALNRSYMYPILCLPNTDHYGICILCIHIITFYQAFLGVFKSDYSSHTSTNSIFILLLPVKQIWLSIKHTFLNNHFCVIQQNLHIKIDKEKKRKIETFVLFCAMIYGCCLCDRLSQSFLLELNSLRGHICTEVIEITFAKSSYLHWGHICVEVIFALRTFLHRGHFCIEVIFA